MLTGFSLSQLLGGLIWFWLLLGVTYLSTRWPRWNFLTMLLFLITPFATLFSWSTGPTNAVGQLGETTIGFVLFWIAFAILFVGASVGWFVFGVWQRASTLSFGSQQSTRTLFPVDDLFSSTDSSLNSSLMIIPFAIGALIGGLFFWGEKSTTKGGTRRTGVVLFIITNAIMFVGYVLFCLLDMPLA